MEVKSKEKKEKSKEEGRNKRVGKEGRCEGDREGRKVMDGRDEERLIAE